MAKKEVLPEVIVLRQEKPQAPADPLAWVAGLGDLLVDTGHVIKKAVGLARGEAP